MKRVTIEPANLRDASFVCANLRPLDQREVFCQMPDGLKTYELAEGMLMQPGIDEHVLIAKLDGQPVGFFGVSPMNAACSSIWALGTKDFRRAAPAVTRHVVDVIVPRLVELGVRGLEARSIVSHLEAHRWMISTGAVVHGEPFEYGKNGELFLLFRWTKAALSLHQSKHRRRR